MSTPIRHLFAQGPVVGALLKTAIGSALGRPRTMPHALPGPWIEATLPPRDPSLVRDYIQFTGGDAAWYAGTLPHHMFPQWSFPLVAAAMRGLPFPLLRAINAGCRLERQASLPANEPLIMRARIESIEQDDRRAMITQRVVTGTRGAPDALVADIRVFVPLGRPDKSPSREPKRAATVPPDAKELAILDLAADAGREFAALTGDINPIHMIPAYARASGFRSCILHGFATFALAIEALDRAHLTGDPSRLTVVDARFTRPLVLPARVGVYLAGDSGIWVGDAPGGGACLEGSIQTEVRP